MRRIWSLTVLVMLSVSVAACMEGADTGQGRMPAEGGQTAEGPVSDPAAEFLDSATEGGWQNFDLLAPSGDPLPVAKDCVQRRSGATSCYVFLTREAYEAAQPRTAGSFRLTCWAARWTRNKTGTESGGRNDFMPPACPASARFENLRPGDGPLAEPAANEPYSLVLTLEPSVTDAHQILLEGTTNLPNGTKLSTSVSREGFMGQDQAVVNGSRWRSGPFGPRTGLVAGTYEVSVTLPYGRTQPEMIQAQLGRQLERLTGPLMKTSSELKFMGQSATVDTLVRVRER